ncbi:MAG: T9SS type A sorting domain-containing protein [Bacteroidetes bacterium]|nr:T9SS type A sorting domain-containing protein [Bacteroidota bacterium]
MRTKLFFLVSFQLFSNCCSAQLSNKWLLGYGSTWGYPGGNVNMDFSNGQLDSIYFYYRDMNFQFANASICDSNGTLLFYTNGVYIANALDDTMKNGSGLNPSWYTTQWKDYGLRIQQGAVIIPKPSNDSLYYLFHQTVDIPNTNIYSADKLYFSIVNMKGDSSKGEVVQKNIVLINDTLTGGGAIGVCKHANGRDWWIISALYGFQITLNIYLLNPDSISLWGTQSILLNGFQGGTTSFSPDGTKYVLSNCFGLAFFDFNRCTGVLSYINKVDTFADSLCWIGSSISPNLRYYYLSHGQYIFQFDLQSSNIPASLDTVAINDGFYDPNPPFQTAFVLHQLAPDGKIYISHGNSTLSLHVIDDPDSAGMACDVQQHAVPLGRFNVTIPNFPNYDLGRLIGSPCDTLQWTFLPSPFGEGLGVRLHPNPSNSSFYIKYDVPTNENLLFVLYDSYGKEVLRKNLYGSFKNLMVHTEQLNNGIYFWRAVADYNTKTQPSIGKPLQGFGVNCATGKVVIVH